MADKVPNSESLGRVVGRGMSWSAASAIWVKAANFAAQIALGFLLTEGDFGVYAIALSVAAVVTTLRDGAVFELLIQRGKSQYEALKGPVFWLAFAANIAIALVLLGLGPIAARFYNQAQVTDILWLLALATVMATPSTTLKATLRIELRFRPLAIASFVSGVAHYGGVVVFAYLGYGPLSFVLPLPIVAVLDVFLLGVATRSRPWLSAPKVALWPELIGEVKWLLGGALCMVLARMGDYAVLGRLVTATVVGVYYFAFQLSVQVAMVASFSIATVLLPTLSQLVGNRTRLTSAVKRSLRALALVASPLSLGLAAVIGPLESLLWGSKWEAAVVPIELLCLMIPLRLSWTIATALLKARAQFRKWALLALVQGVGLIAVAFVAGWLELGADGIALWVTVYFIVASPALLAVSLTGLDESALRLATAIAPAWLLAVASGAASFAITELALPDLAALPLFLVRGVSFVAVFTLGARLLLTSHLVDLLRVLPGALGRPLAAVLRLPQSS